VRCRTLSQEVAPHSAVLGYVRVRLPTVILGPHNSPQLVDKQARCLCLCVAENQQLFAWEKDHVESLLVGRDLRHSDCDWRLAYATEEQASEMITALR